jgi:hypothetical protein
MTLSLLFLYFTVILALFKVNYFNNSHLFFFIALKFPMELIQHNLSKHSLLMNLHISSSFVFAAVFSIMLHNATINMSLYAMYVC